MQKASGFQGIALAAICLLAAVLVALSAPYALAAEYVPGQRTLTVTAAQGIAEDMAAVDVQLDVYKIGTAQGSESYQAYDYALTEPYDAEDMQAAMDGADWEALAAGAKDIVSASLADVSSVTQVPGYMTTGSVGQTMAIGADEEQGNGVYLVLPHGSANAPDSLMVASADFSYTFSPIIVVLPYKDAMGPDGNPNSAYGNWIADASIELKAQRALNFGSLVINKEVTGGGSERSTFVFHLTGTQPDGRAYDNYASITYPDQRTTTVSHIPVGTEITVVEEYEGARFEGQTPAQEIVIAADDANGNPTTAPVSFSNVSSNDSAGGHGIENHFVLTRISSTVETESAWDWVWSATPADEARERSASN